MSPLVASIVGEKMASLKELQTEYSYTDALDMAEVIRVKYYNEWAAAQEAEQQHGRKHHR